MTCKMTYTPKTKRPTVKSLLEGLKRTQAELHATQIMLDTNVSNLRLIAMIARDDNNFGQRKATIDRILNIASK